MAFQKDVGMRKTDSLNGFLRRWRRNACQAGVVTAVVTGLVAAAAVFTLCACKSLFR